MLEYRCGRLKRSGLGLGLPTSPLCPLVLALVMKQSRGSFGVSGDCFLAVRHSYPFSPDKLTGMAHRVH